MNRRAVVVECIGVCKQSALSGILCTAGQCKFRSVRYEKVVKTPRPTPGAPPRGGKRGGQR